LTTRKDSADIAGGSKGAPTKPLTKEGIEFLAGKHFAALTTLHRDGSPHTTPIWYLYDDGRLIVNTTPERVKVRNIRRDARVNLLVHEAYRYVMIEGQARIARERDPMRDIETLAVRYEGEAEGRRSARNYYWKQERISLEIIPQRFVENLG